MEPSSMSAAVHLEARVRRLESQVKTSRLIALAALVGLVAVTALGAGRGLPEVVRAQRFEVLNRQGKPVVVLKNTGFGGQVQTLGHEDASGVSMGASSHGGFIGVRDKRSTLFPRIELSTDEKGGLLAVRSWSGFAVEVDRDGLAISHTQESRGFNRSDARVLLSVGEEGGRVRLWNGIGDEVITLTAGRKNGGLTHARGVGR